MTLDVTWQCSLMFVGTRTVPLNSPLLLSVTLLLWLLGGNHPHKGKCLSISAGDELQQQLCIWWTPWGLQWDQKGGLWICNDWPSLLSTRTFCSPWLPICKGGHLEGPKGTCSLPSLIKEVLTPVWLSGILHFLHTDFGMWGLGWSWHPLWSWEQKES